MLVSGSFTGNVINQGSLSTANGPAIITITGNYTENSAAILSIQVAGTSAFDQLHVSGTVTLDGTLNLSLLNSFLPDPSETFAIVSARHGVGNRILPAAIQLQWPPLVQHAVRFDCLDAARDHYYRQFDRRQRQTG